MYVCVERGGRKCICIKSKEKYTRVRAPQYGGDLYAKKKKIIVYVYQGVRERSE